MEHIRQFDWCSSQPDRHFLEEDDIDNCVIERIISNTFRDPMLLSDSEDERVRYKPKMDWNQIFKRTENEGGAPSVFVPGFRPPPPYPKLSALSVQQHYQCLKVLCKKNPDILATEFIPKPKNLDFKVFEESKNIYLKEQKEYLEWAKSLWNNSHNVRALRPRPLTENVYEAEFKMRAKSLESFPKSFEMAAHISLANRTNKCEMTLLEDLVKVNVSDLPKVDISEPLTKKFSIFSPCPVPEPCDKHPCWFTLPNERQLSVLPLSEVHVALAQWAGERGAGAAASERALLSLLRAGAWALPLSVCEVIAADGEKKNVLVLGSDFSTQKQSAVTRTYKAFRHLLEYALLPLNEKAKLLSKETESEAVPSGAGSAGAEPRDEHLSDDECDDDEDWFGNLVIDEGENSESQKTSDMEPVAQDKKTEISNGRCKDDSTDGDKTDKTTDKQNNNNTEKESTKKTDGFYTCTCSDSALGNPPPRSFRKWQIKNKTNNEKFDMVIHCSHKMKGPSGQEVIVEPIVEYQIELGGTQQSPETIRCAALSLLLRNNASLLNVRVDNSTGEIVTIDNLSLEDLTKEYNNIMEDISNVIYETLNQLKSLLPGRYILQHESTHGENAFLYASRVRGDGNKFNLHFDCTVLAEADETKSLKTPPLLTDVLLPIHKYRKTLPCAFSPFERLVARPRAPPAARARPPPHALRWPKRKHKKNKRKD